MILDISTFTTLDFDDVKKILTTLTLTSSNITTHNSPRNPPPPLVKISNTQVICSTTGILSNPYQFLIRELRERFKNDYDKAIQTRESTFRDLLYKNFRSKNVAKSLKGVEIKGTNKAKLTDIDAIIYDLSDGTLALFQLKWMDPFGDSMKERRNKLSNFSNRASNWVEIVSTWLSKNDPSLLLANFESSEIAASKVSSVQLYVIGRQFSNFSGATNDARAIWSNLYQIQRLEKQNTIGFQFLKDFSESLTNDYFRKDLILVYTNINLKVGRYAINYPIILS